MSIVKMITILLFISGMLGCSEREPQSNSRAISVQQTPGNVSAESVSKQHTLRRPVSIAVKGVNNITEKACTGPFTVTINAQDGKPVGSTDYSTFWLTIVGTAAGWTKFYEDAACKKPIQEYIDNRGDGETKPRLDFGQGVAQLSFYLKSKKITASQPTIKVWRTDVEPEVGPWVKIVSLRVVNDAAMAAPSQLGIGQNSLARAAKVSAPQSFNSWADSSAALDRYSITNAQLWRDELIIQGEPALGGDQHLSAINVGTGKIRRFEQWNAHERYFEKQRLVKEKISGKYLLRQYGRAPSYLAWLDLESGESGRSPALELHIDDFSVRHDLLIISHSKAIEQKSAIAQRRQYSISTYDLRDFRSNETQWAGNEPPIIVGDRAYSKLTAYSRGGPSLLIVTPIFDDGEEDKEFEGDWKLGAEDCKRRLDEQTLNNARFHIEISGCGTIRGVDFEERRVFRFALDLSDQFLAPEYSLSKNNLVVQGKFVNANRGAGDRGRPLYLFNLARGQWQGRLPAADYDSNLTANESDNVLLYRQGECANPFDSIEERGALKSPVTVQYVSRLIEAEIGPRGAEISRKFHSELLPYQDPSFARFLAITAEVPKIDQPNPNLSMSGSKSRRPTLQDVRSSVGEFALNNSVRFRNHLAQRGVSWAQAVAASRACEYIDLPMFREVNGKQAGLVSLTLKPGAVDIEAKGWYADIRDMNRKNVPIHYPPNSGAALLVYKRSGDTWFRLTKANEPEIWVDVGLVSEEFVNSFRQRDPSI